MVHNPSVGLNIHEEPAVEGDVPEDEVDVVIRNEQERRDAAE